MTYKIDKQVILEATKFENMDKITKAAVKQNQNPNTPLATKDRNLSAMNRGAKNQVEESAMVKAGLGGASFVGALKAKDAIASGIGKAVKKTDLGDKLADHADNME